LPELVALDQEFGAALLVGRDCGQLLLDLLQRGACLLGATLRQSGVGLPELLANLDRGLHRPCVLGVEDLGQ